MTSKLDSRFSQVIGSPVGDKAFSKTFLHLDPICVLEDLPNNEEWCSISNDELTITEESEDSYWPNLEASIAKKIKFKDVSIECVVCRTDVTVFPRDHIVTWPVLIFWLLCRPEDIAPIQGSLKKSDLKTTSQFAHS
ncbi:hypothetical protein FMUND_4067 [Fusarium mundagurra]|uniref:Uncharacterized protein n=1 Tax=Fusarium mundagurra TaxID=1567541 RepID=A0A8H5Z0S8_9HYPO|nr:hypothetical protein FMUND_4067 [Fusarium mundagurra]